MPRWKAAIALCLVLSAMLTVRTAALAAEPGIRGAQPGDYVWNFLTVLRRDWWNEDLQQTIPAGTTLRLDDFAGKILFIQYFDPYCSICREGLTLTATQIKDYYQNQGGNAHGVPVVYLPVNLEPADYAQYEADRLMDMHSMFLRGNDYTDTQVDISVNIFASHTAKPVFVAINCVANSPSHQQGQLLLNKSGVVESQIPGLITTWKSIIDSVEAPRPALDEARLFGNGTFAFTFQGQLNATYLIESTTNLVSWDFVSQVVGTNGPIVFQDLGSTSRARRFFRVIRP